MHLKKFSIAIGVIIIFVTGLMAGKVLKILGSTDSPSVPGSTNSYTLEDIYNRLNAGTLGSQSTFTEPTTAPGTGTMHTLNEIMAKIPDVDDASGASASQVLSGKTFWGLTSGEWGHQTGSLVISLASATRVPNTGQTTSFETGDDGDYQLGISPKVEPSNGTTGAYTVYGWADTRFTDNLNGTVTDNYTGLIWLKNANPCGFQTWADALIYCNNLANGTAGLTDGSTAGDWRLPNINELHSLCDLSQSNPALPTGHPFSNVQHQFSYYPYYSSTTDFVRWLVDIVMVVPMINGDVTYDSKEGPSSYVWPVRGGQ